MGLMAAGKYSAADQKFHKVLAQLDRLKIFRGDLKPRTLFNLANSAYKQGYAEEALKGAVQTFAYLRQFQDAAQVRAAIDWLGDRLVENGAHGRAVQILELSVEGWRKASGEESLEVGRRLFPLGPFNWVAE